MIRLIPKLQRFWAKVERGDGCWEWTGARNHNGYGVMHSGPKATQVREFAHRVSWEIHNGPIPSTARVLHHCDNPPCVRPDHLWLGTKADNQRDMAEKGRSLRGERHPQWHKPQTNPRDPVTHRFIPRVQQGMAL